MELDKPSQFYRSLRIRHRLVLIKHARGSREEKRRPPFISPLMRVRLSSKFHPSPQQNRRLLCRLPIMKVESIKIQNFKFYCDHTTLSHLIAVIKERHSMAEILVGQTNLRIDSLKNKGIYVVNSNKIKQRRPLGPETHQTGFKSRKSGLIKPFMWAQNLHFSESGIIMVYVSIVTKTRCIV